MNNCNCDKQKIDMAVCGPSGTVLPSETRYITKVIQPSVIKCGNIMLEPWMMSVERTKYVIKWNFDLDGKTITVPEKCVLEFDGGSLKNGTIIGQDTFINNVGGVETIFGAGITQEGTWRYSSSSSDPKEGISREAADELYQPKGSYQPAGDYPTTTEVNEMIGEIEGGKDKEYNPAEFSGLGKVYLKKNIVKVDDVEKNILTQSAFYKEGTEIPNTDTIYVIQYNFDLNGQTIQIPVGCTLDFDGGSINNGTLTGNDTSIINTTLSTKILSDTVLEGSWKKGIHYNNEGIEFSQFVGRTIAHRGYPYSVHNRFAQDNSLAAIDEAGLAGFTGIECDPRRDVNGVIVLMHDADVSSVSNQTGLIEDLDYRTIFYKDKYGQSTNRHITTLAEAVAVCKAYNMFMVFDHKGYDNKGRSVSIGDLMEVMEAAGYRNFGVMNYDEDYMADKPDYIIKFITPKTSVEALHESLAKFSYLPSIVMRKYSPRKDDVPIEVLRECKKLGLKIGVNYTNEPGTEIDSSEEDYIKEAYQYYDYFIGDDHIMAGRRTSVGETEGGVIKCIGGNLPVPRMLQDESVTVDGVTTYPYKNGLASFTYKDSLWAINHYGMPNPRLITGYITAGQVNSKIPELAHLFPGGVTVLTTLMAQYRSTSFYISGDITLPRLVVQNIYNSSSGNNESISTYEVVHDKNAASLLETFAKNMISHSGNIPSIGTDYKKGEWRELGDGSDAYVVNIKFADDYRITKGIRLNGDTAIKGCAYEIADFTPGIYTFSFYIKGTGSNFSVSLHNAEKSFYYPIVFSGSEEYIRKVVTIDITENMLYSGTILIIRITTNDSSADVTLCGFMLQQGRMITAWTPKDTDYSELDSTEDNYIKYSNVPSIGTNYSIGNWRAIANRTNGLLISDVTIPSVPQIRKALKIDRQTYYSADLRTGYAYEITNFTPGIYMLSFYAKGNTNISVFIDNAGTTKFNKSVSIGNTTYEKVNIKLDISAEDLNEGNLLVLQLSIVGDDKHAEICGLRLYRSNLPLPWCPSISDYPTSGTTANRPPEPEIGFRYFDTTISPARPIYYAGNGNWVDATGAII